MVQLWLPSVLHVPDVRVAFDESLAGHYQKSLRNFDATYISSPSLLYSFACDVPEITRNLSPLLEYFKSLIFQRRQQHGHNKELDYLHNNSQRVPSF